MAKSPEAFRTISEVADWLGVQAHVLRFWESKFSQVKPVKRAGGRRYYRPADMLLLGGIKKLLHDDGMTIKGVQKTLREQGTSFVADHSPSLDDLTMAQLDNEISTILPQDQSTVLPFETPASDVKPSETAVPESPTVDEVLAASAQQSAPITESTDEPIAQETPVAEEITPAEDVAEVEPEAPMPEVVSAEPEEALAQDQPVETPPEPLAENEPVPEQDSPTEPELALATEAEPEPEPTPEAEAETENAAPAFIRRTAKETPAPTPKAPLIVDAPDAPPEDQIEVPPGILARLSALDSIPASQIDKLRNAKAQLEALHARLSGNGKE